MTSGGRNVKQTKAAAPDVGAGVRADTVSGSAGVGGGGVGGGHRLLKIMSLAVGLTLAAIGLIVYLFGIAHFWYGLHDISDTGIYVDFAARMAHGLRPYVDFPVEYPPLAIPLFVIPGHSGNVVAYSDWFNVEMFVMCAAAAAATAAAAARLWTTGRKPYLVGVAFAVCVLATGAIIGNRYDAAVALLLAVVMLLLSYEMWTNAAFVLGLGFALKLTPAILLPLVFVLAVRRRTIIWGLIYFVLAAVLPFVPFLIHGFKGLEYPFTYQLDRPLQVESVLAAPLLLGHIVGHVWVEIGTAYGSQFISATGAVTLARISGFLELVALAVTYCLIWRRRATLRATPRLVPLAVLALILAFMTFGKVLSPQYFIWILPAIALVLPERRALGLLLIGAVVLTQLEFPANYWSFIYLNSGAVLLVVERDAVLCLAFAFSLWHLWRLPDIAPNTQNESPGRLGP
jgi:hypothetical protein